MQDLAFQSARLSFAPLRIEDAEEMFAYASDPEVAAYTSWEAHQHPDDTSAYIRHVQSRHDVHPNRFHVVWAIRERTCEGVIGTISFRTESSSVGHLDYALSRDFWGKGLMSEAVKAFLNILPVLLPSLEEVHSGCLAKNAGSVRVLEKCGFSLHNSYQSIRGGKFGGTLLTTYEYILRIISDKHSN